MKGSDVARRKECGTQSDLSGIDVARCYGGSSGGFLPTSDNPLRLLGSREVIGVS